MMEIWQSKAAHPTSARKQRERGGRGGVSCKRNTLQSHNFWDLVVVARARLLIAQPAVSAKMRLGSSRPNHLLTAPWAEAKPSACDAFGGTLPIQTITAGNQLEPSREDIPALRGWSSGQGGRYK